MAPFLLLIVCVLLWIAMVCDFVTLIGVTTGLTQEVFLYLPFL